MQKYRAYIIEDEKAFKNFSEFGAADDGEALRKAERLVNGNAVELWAGSRLIGKIKPVKRRVAYVDAYI